MTKFIPREKMSKKARRELDAVKRKKWDMPPVTRKIENKKHRPCSRYEDYGAGSYVL
ncbi:MAG: hypothetical protein IJ354_07790 [Clostridia bacterium]|nr:hypothetical protein [Clostridia bacterium]